MTNKKFYITAIILSLATILTFAFEAFAQRPPQRGMEWFERFDANKNGRLEAEEYKAATDEFFKKIDRNNDGLIDDAERPRKPPPRPEQLPPDGAELENQTPRAPFFVMESLRTEGDLSRAQYEENVTRQFKLMDKNGDGTLSREEAQSRFDE